MTLAPLSKPIAGGIKSIPANDNPPNYYMRSLEGIVGFIIKIIQLVVLLGFSVLTALVWLWLLGFRTGSRFGDWLYQYWNTEDSQKNNLALLLLYDSILALFSPLGLFGAWSQAQLTKIFQIKWPSLTNLKGMISNQLGNDFSQNALCLPTLEPVNKDK
jgi:hypothetical protein